MDRSQAIPGAPGSSGSAAAERVARLRGAGVDVDRRRLLQVVAVVVLLAFAATSVGLFAVGAHRNGQIDTLRDDGRLVEARVTGCLGLLGGSGSNAAGYTCRATYDVDGRRYVQTVPGNVVRSPGSRVPIVVAASDPTLVDTPGALAREHASWHVDILPSVLALVFVGGLVLVITWWRRVPSRPPPGQDDEDSTDR